MSLQCRNCFSREIEPSIINDLQECQNCKVRGDKKYFEITRLQELQQESEELMEKLTFVHEEIKDELKKRSTARLKSHKS